jgi:hypothetical protein
MARRLFGLILAAMITSATLAISADTTTFPPGKTFTFKSKECTLGKVLDEVAKQTGVIVDRSKAESERTLRIECDKLPFWDALERIAKESDHRVSFADTGRKLQLQGGGDIVYRESPMSVDRVFRVAVKKIQAVAELEMDQTFVEVTLSVSWEPGIALFLVEEPGRSVTVKDNVDQDVRVIDQGGGRVNAFGNTVDLTMRLAGIPRSAKSIKSMEGKVGVIGAAKMLSFSFDKPIAGKEYREASQEGVTVKLRTDFKEGSDLWTARVEFEYPEGGPQLESYESASWLVDNQAWIATADGKKKLEYNGGYEVAAQGDRRAVVIYRFTDEPGTKLGKPEDWVFHVRTPSKLLTTDVKFRLENIPLP